MAANVNEHLAEVPLFAPLSKKQLKHVSAVTTRLSVPAGTVVAQEGAVGREMMVIVEGSAEVRKGDAAVATFGPGDFFGEIALLSDQPRTASVVATTDLELEVIERRDFRALASDHAEISRVVTAAIEARMVKPAPSS